MSDLVAWAVQAGAHAPLQDAFTACVHPGNHTPRPVPVPSSTRACPPAAHDAGIKGVGTADAAIEVAQLGPQERGLVCRKVCAVCIIMLLARHLAFSQQAARGS